MVKQFLITRPRHDKHTSYLYSFSKSIVQIAKENQSIRLTELEGIKANRKMVETSLSTFDPTLAFFNGHGDHQTVLGHNNLPVLDGNNIKLAKEKIVYALACDSLTTLGVLAIKEGAKAYIGYKDEFMWLGDPSKSATPDKDKNSAPFRRVCHFLINSLVKGIPVGTAVEKTKIEYEKLIETYGGSEDYFGDAPAIRFALTWDLLALGLHGNPTITF